MLQPYSPVPPPLVRMPDGTVKQLNPFSGTQVWTVPGRGHRPLNVDAGPVGPIETHRWGRFCAFCEDRLEHTPAEKSRMVRTEWGWERRDAVGPTQLHDTVAEFRRVPNLFEILPYRYWVDNYGYTPPQHLVDRHDAYLADPVGRAQMLTICRTKALAAGTSVENWAEHEESEQLAASMGFFAGGHDVIIARRHFVDGATQTDQLASSGTLTPDEHAAYVTFTAEAIRDLYAVNRYARYVAAFQNWLKPAGASFDHLHKQVVAIDDRGVQAELELMRLRANPNLYNEWGVNYAAQQNLVIAENDHAVAFAGFGHRYPTLEVYAKSDKGRPWELAEDELRGFSDLLHALHAAAGPAVPCNEEWHHQPIDVAESMPLRANVKWRVSTLAGFEGGTKVYLNTIDPWTLRDRVVPRLFELRAEGRVAPMAIATECPARPNPLRYSC